MVHAATDPMRAAAQHLLPSAAGAPITPAELAAITRGRHVPPGLAWLLTQTSLPGSTLVYDGPNAHDLYGIIGDGLLVLSPNDVAIELECCESWPRDHAMLPLLKAFHMQAGRRIFTGNSITCIDLSPGSNDPPVTDVPFSDGPSADHNLPIAATLSQFLRDCRSWNEAIDSVGHRWPD